MKFWSQMPIKENPSVEEILATERDVYELIESRW